MIATTNQLMVTKKKRVVAYIDEEKEMQLRMIALKQGIKSLSEFISVLCDKAIEEDQSNDE